MTKPPAPCEPIDLRTDDGWSLRADVREPSPPAAGTAVLSHAVMARRAEFDDPPGAGLASFFVDRGWRVITFDFRGHGDSGPDPHAGAGWGYDDLVAHDLPVAAAFARSRTPRAQPVVLVGHSVGGHAALAAQGLGGAFFDAIVAAGANVWLAELEPSRARWAVKRASLLAAVALCRRVGRFPARALHLGSDDESRGYCEDIDRFARTGAWASADGRVDYGAALSRVKVPVLHLVSDGDRLECVPECGARFTSRCAGLHEVLRVSRGDDGSPPPGSMGLVKSRAVCGVWVEAEAWMRRLRGGRRAR